MKIYLNLLPEDKKNKIKQRKRIKLIIKQELILLAISSFLIIILFNISLILKIEMDSLEKNYSQNQSQSKYQELKDYENKFKEINLRSSLLSGLDKEHIYWSNLFRKLGEVSPDGVLLNGLTNNGYNVSLSGIAGKRENLILFQNNIQADECFEKVNIPLSDLVVKENINFQVDFAIKENCLKKEE